MAPDVFYQSSLAIGDYELPSNLNIRRTIFGYKIVDHLDVVGASLISAAPTTSSFST